MKVHHLNCGSMSPPASPPLVCHVLLLELEDSLALVDTGFGLADIADPGARLGPARHLIRPVLDRAETAIEQVRRRGLDPRDVRHLVLTHLDLDHAGGLADFPWAQVHTTVDEAAGAVWAPSVKERIRYRRTQWSHGPRLVGHEPDGERWRGLATAKPLSDVGDGVVLVALPGHSRGHAAVAVDAGDHWVLHAGDAFYHRATLEGGHVPRALVLQDRVNSFDLARVHDNHERLAELHRRAEPDLHVVNAHDPVLLQRMQAL